MSSNSRERFSLRYSFMAFLSLFHGDPIKSLMAFDKTACIVVFFSVHFASNCRATRSET